MGYEKMRVYHAAERLRRLVDELQPDLRRGFSVQFRHVDEAIDSVLNNIAEGSDCVYPAKKIEFFDIARNSANEAGSGLRNLGNRKAFGARKTTRAVNVAFTIQKMLAALIEVLREGTAGIKPETRLRLKKTPLENAL
jgi:four helix bundle protein